MEDGVKNRSATCASDGGMEKVDQNQGGLEHSTGTLHRDVSVARWQAEIGMAEVLVKKGKMWGSMGVIRNSKLYCHVEEALYLVEHGNLLLLLGDKIMLLQEVYDLLVIPTLGCSWDAYQIFSHLKRLGYIVGRHDILWTNSSKRVRPNPVEACTESGSRPKEQNLTPENLTLGLGEINVEWSENEEVRFEEDHPPSVNLGPWSGVTDGDKQFNVDSDASCGLDEISVGVCCEPGAYRIPRFEEPGGCASRDAQSVQKLRKGHNYKNADEDSINCQCSQDSGISTVCCEPDHEAILRFEEQGDCASTDTNRFQPFKANEVCNTNPGCEDSLRFENAGRPENAVYLSNGSERFGLDEVVGEDCSAKLSLLFTNLKVVLEQGDTCFDGERSCEFNALFDVHQPNARFKKTAPGSPAFILCVVGGGRPPDHSQVRALELRIGDIPLKFGFVDYGHVSLFSFTSCTLPTLI